MSALHVNDVVAGIARKAHLVRHDDLRHALGIQRLHDMENLVDQLGVKSTGGFIVEHDLRLHGKSTGDGGALLLPAREVRGIPLHMVTEADLFQQGAPSFFRILTGNASDDNGSHHGILKKRAVGEEVELLKNHADALAEHMGTFLKIRIQLGSGHSRNAGTGRADDAGVQRFQAIDAAQHRAFAATRRPNDRDQIALLDGEAHAFENRSLIKTFVEILDRDDRSRIH